MGEGDKVGEILATEFNLITEQIMLHLDHRTGATPHSSGEIKRAHRCWHIGRIKRRPDLPADSIDLMTDDTAFLQKELSTPLRIQRRDDKTDIDQSFDDPRSFFRRHGLDRREIVPVLMALMYFPHLLKHRRTIGGEAMMILRRFVRRHLVVSASWSPEAVAG